MATTLRSSGLPPIRTAALLSEGSCDLGPRRPGTCSGRSAGASGTPSVSYSGDGAISPPAHTIPVAEREGFSDKLPKAQDFCAFPNPLSRSCVSQACIPGNQETRAVPQPVGVRIRQLHPFLMDGDSPSKVGYRRATGEYMPSSRFTVHDPNQIFRRLIREIRSGRAASIFGPLSVRRGQVRSGLPPGGRWIRTFGSARYLMAVRGRLLEAYSRSFRIRP